MDDMTYESIQPAQTSIEAELERLTCSAYLFGLDEDRSNPILSLDSSDRIVFLLHHLLAYKVEKAALLAEMSEIEFRMHLRSAYLQLASFQFGYDVYFTTVEEPALA
jgi:DNA-directed RNA polymerase specialized sigma24 family protein